MHGCVLSNAVGTGGAVGTLGDFRNISTISIFLLAVTPYNFYNLETKRVYKTLS